jgi:hypothetical protein
LRSGRAQPAAAAAHTSFDPARIQTAVLTVRSADGGWSWSPPQQIGVFKICTRADPEGREPAAAAPAFGTAAIVKPDLAVAPDGTTVNRRVRRRAGR